MADPAFGPWQMARYKAIDASGVGAGVKQAEAAVHDADTLLGLYRRMNAAGAMDAQVQADFGGGLSDPHEARLGRQYVGWWETRNLRMLANIREAVATTPGVRVLNAVGASHKPWYDQWARQMGDVDAVPAASGLGP